MRTLGAACTVLIGGMLACSGTHRDALTEPGSAPYIAGRVTALVRTGSTASVRVEANPGSAAQGLKAVAAVDGATLVLLPGRVVGDPRSLAIGQWVRVWFDGAILETYPVQGTASAVVVDSLGVVPIGS